jgi:hypothetical protein
MVPSEYFVESCTLFDDQYLTYQDLVEYSIQGEIESRSQLNADGFSFAIKNDYRFIIWYFSLSSLRQHKNRAESWVDCLSFSRKVC